MNLSYSRNRDCKLPQLFQAGSIRRPGWLYVPSRMLYNLRNRGLLFTLRVTFKPRLDVLLTWFKTNKALRKNSRHFPGEILELKPGEQVVVKSWDEIAETLDDKGKFKGLVFTPEMKKLCGQEFRVFKRLVFMFDECNREKRRIENTVLLEGAMCSGEGIGCDRSCFHYWRELWLRRVVERSKVDQN